MPGFYGKYGHHRIISSKVNESESNVFQPAVIIANIQAEMSVPFSSLNERLRDHFKRWSQYALTLEQIQDNNNIRIETRCHAMLIRAKVLHYIYQVYDAANHKMGNYNQSSDLCLKLPKLLLSAGSCSSDGVNILTEAFEFSQAFDTCVSETFRETCKDLWPEKIEENPEQVLSSAHWNLMM